MKRAFSFCLASKNLNNKSYGRFWNVHCENLVRATQRIQKLSPKSGGPKRLDVHSRFVKALFIFIFALKIASGKFTLVIRSESEKHSLGCHFSPKSANFGTHHGHDHWPIHWLMDQVGSHTKTPAVGDVRSSVTCDAMCHHDGRQRVDRLRYSPRMPESGRADLQNGSIFSEWI